MTEVAPIVTAPAAPVDMEHIGHTPAVAAQIEATKPKLVPVKLLKNYRPIGDYEVVGHDRPAKLRKNAAGVMVEVEPAEFVADALPEPVLSGTGTGGKIWAGAIIRLPVDEAKAAKKAGIIEYELDD